MSALLSAFVHRRPWVAAVAGLLLGPFVGMLYLGEGVTALCYLAASLAINGLPPLVAHAGLLPVDAETAIVVLLVAYRLGGAVHCERVARRRAGEVPAARLARWYSVAALGLVLPVGLRMFVWEPYFMPSGSMEPSLRAGDYVIAVKLPYLLSTPRRGDLVVFLLPTDGTTPYVKRLIGLPGDRVQMKEGVLHINGVAVPREAVARKPPGFADDIGTIYRESLPEGGSHLIREISDDRRLDETGVYEVPPGHYFFLGDNRDNSLDSRIDVGYVPHENFIGRIVVVLWNSESQRLRVFDSD